jgi:hypothetical protein
MSNAEMNKLATTGLILLLLGIVAWLFLLVRIGPQTRNPLTVQYPTTRGAIFHESFRIRSPGRYGVYITFLRTGPLEQVVSEFGNADKTHRIPCDIVVKFSKADRTVFEDTVSSLVAASMDNERLAYSLRRVDLDEEGLYDVEVLNRSDLTYLAPSDPHFEIQTSSIVVVDRAAEYWIRTFICLVVCLLGLVLLAVGVIRRRRQTLRLARMKPGPAAG